MPRFVFLFLVVATLAACKQTATEQTASGDSVESSPEYREVMAIHDAVMPEMTTLHDLKKALKQAETPENRTRILAEISRMERADEAMMEWMAAFDVPADKDKVAAYLALEKGKIQAVSDSMNQVIADVKQFLAKNSLPQNETNIK
jgi:hypothetical protein